MYGLGNSMRRSYKGAIPKLDGITCIELRRRKRGPARSDAARRDVSIEGPRMP